MNDFKRNNRFGGKKQGFGRPSFGDRGGFRGGDRGGFGGGRDKEMFSTVCASCGKTCEVPFRPNGKKPVYCKECFAANGGPAAPQGDRMAPRREFNRPAPRHEAFRTEVAGGNLAEIKKQIEILSGKIDRLVETLAVPAPQTAPTETPVKVPAKAKKVAAKKKKN